LNGNREQGTGNGKGQLPDEAARERVRTQLDQTFVVEAGAGTGKTRLLVDRVENLVASGKARLRNVVAITFTEKAAAELRVAIRQRMGARLTTPSPQPSPPNGGEGVSRERFRTALADLEIAPVSTIHAFAAELLRERPVEAGVDPAFAVADELQASLFRTEAWDRWLEKQKDRAPEGLKEAIEFGLSLTQLREVGDDLIRFRDILTADLDRGPQPQDPLLWLRGAEPVMRAAVKRVATDCRDKSDQGAADLLDLQQSLELLGRLADSESRRAVLGGMLRLKIRGAVGRWKPGALAQIRERLGALADELAALRTAHGHWLAAGAVNWLRGYVAEYQALKAREGILDFDDLLLLARNMLRDNREVRRDFQERFEAILVDEFQDTDPLQAEIIFFLAEDGAGAAEWTAARLVPGKLFIVGDPKQSIYAFRRADIETYERAKEALTQSGALEFITANFRSVQPILDAVNATFTNHMRRPLEGSYQPDYVALQPSTETPAANDSPTLLLLYPDPSADSTSDVATLRGIEAEGVAAFLRRMIDGGMWKVGRDDDRRPATFGDVALLFRGMSDVPIYEEELKRYGIPYRVTSSRTFYKREEIGWLLNVLHAVEHPTDPVAVWGALRSPLCGCSDREVYEFIAGGGTFDYRGNAGTRERGNAPPESIASAYAVLNELHANRNLQSVPRMVEEVLVRTNALPIFLLTPQGEQRVANLAKVVQLARALEGSGILTYRAFVHWLRDMEKNAVDEAESPTVEEGDDVVRIMSIHAAKGLEFPIVVIPDLGRTAGGRGDHLVLHRIKSEAGFYFGKVGAGGWPVQTNNFERLKTDNTQREAAERLRVLYVAMTRAKDALVLPVFPKRPANTMMVDLAHVLPMTVPGFDRPHGQWIVIDGTTVGRVERDPSAIRLQLPEVGAAGPAADTDRTRWLASRDASLASAGVPDKRRLPSRLVDPTALLALKRLGMRPELTPGGRMLGDLVHQVLAVIPLDRPDLAAEYVRYFARQKRTSDAIADRAIAFVQGALDTPVVRMALAGRSWREVPFAMAEVDGTLVEGDIDLIVEAADGKIVVADWKTDTTDPAKRQAVMDLYAAQLDAYDAVLKRLGYESEQRLVLLGLT
jgi:ATP-dependent exoDNAse (exonuclease V) beta subunit